MIRILNLPAALFAALTTASMLTPLHAGEPVKVNWSQLCTLSQGHELSLTTDSGEVVQGSCIGIDVDGVSVKTRDARVIRVARQTLRRIQYERARGHQLRSLGRMMHAGLSEGTKMVFSPAAPIGLAAVPSVIAWGAVSAPFCVIGDLHERRTTKAREIVIK